MEDQHHFTAFIALIKDSIIGHEEGQLSGALSRALYPSPLPDYAYSVTEA